MEESTEMQKSANEELNINPTENQNANEVKPTEETVATTEAVANQETEPTQAPACVAPEATSAETITTEGDATEGEIAEPEVDYSQMSREELTEALNVLLNEEVQTIKNRVSQIRAHFNTLNREVENQAFEAFLASGGNKEDYQAAGDDVAIAFRKAYDRYHDMRQKHADAVEAEKQRNLDSKRAILEELRRLVDRDDDSLKQKYDDFNAIQERWKAVGEVPRDQVNDLWQNYHFLIEQFFNKVNQCKELRQLDLKRNLEVKLQLCEKAEELVLESSITKSFKALQDLRSQWREVGPVPTEQNDDIWQRFCNAANQIDERRKNYYDQRKEEFDKNLLAKQALIEKANELTENTPTTTKQWNDITTELDELLKIWKTIGPVPREVNEETWQKFKGVIDKHYEQKKIYFGQIRDEQSDNYAKKVELCLKAEAIAKREDWKKATDELLQLQTEWKAIGPVSRKVSEKVWQRFRSACDEFFAKKEAHFSTIRGNESENLAQKEAIIAELKAFEFGDSKDDNLNAIKEFQRRWAAIGFVPIADKDRLQKEFRGVINDHFEKLRITAREAEENAYRERIHNAGGDTKKFVSGERDNLLEKIQKIENDIKLWENNLGFLSNSRQADLLREEFEKKMQNARGQIGVLRAKLRILDEEKKKAEE